MFAQIYYYSKINLSKFQIWKISITILLFILYFQNISTLLSKIYILYMMWIKSISLREPVADGTIYVLSKNRQLYFRYNFREKCIGLCLLIIIQGTFLLPPQFIAASSPTYSYFLHLARISFGGNSQTKS